MSTADEIKKLNDLLKDRVITQEEFDLQKEKLLNSSTTTSTTDWLTLFLLTFFVGVLGVHRFYVGKIGTGFLMLLTLGGLGVWFLVDLILVVTGQFTNKDGEKRKAQEFISQINEMPYNDPNSKIDNIMWGFWNVKSNSMFIDEFKRTLLDLGLEQN